MSDISVLAVQKALRQHADFGHDVIRDPRMVHLGEIHDPSIPYKGFGMAVGHSLHIRLTDNPSEMQHRLETNLINGENNSTSSIFSTIGFPHEKDDSPGFPQGEPKLLTPHPTLIHRNLSIGFPHVKGDGSSHYLSTPNGLYLYENGLGQNRMHYGTSIQDALKHAQVSPSEYFNKFGLPADEETRNKFKPQEALANYLRNYGPRGSGPITVISHGKTHPNEYNPVAAHSYDPDTEQLIKLTD